MCPARSETIIFGRFPRYFFKDYRKIFRVHIAAFGADFVDRNGAVLQIFFCELDPFFCHIFIKAFLHSLFKQKTDIGRRLAKNLSDGVQIQGIGQMRMDIERNICEQPLVGGSRILRIFDLFKALQAGEDLLI